MYDSYVAASELHLSLFTNARSIRIFVLVIVQHRSLFVKNKKTLPKACIVCSFLKEPALFIVRVFATRHARI